MAEFPDSRAPFAWLRERDIDLLFCSELHARGDVSKLLASKVGESTATVESAWVSHAEVDGESDLVVVLAGSTGRIVVLIENKISAAFQPDQGIRYKARAERLADLGRRTVTVLVAPAGYHGRDGSEHFDVAINYEEIAAVAAQAGDQRSIFFAQALLGAADTSRRSYVPVPDGAVSDMWMACWRVATEFAPKLRFRQPGLKPGRSTWFYFRDAEGFAKGASAVVVYKAERGQVDLQFAGMTAAELAACTGAWLKHDMKVVAANKSASVRVHVPEIDFAGSADEQQAALQAGVKACDLRMCYVEKMRRSNSESAETNIVQ